MSILKNIFCKEKVRVLPVEIKKNDYMSAVENNTRKIYGDKCTQYGYIYNNSIVIYQVERFAEQDSQTQMAALLFEVQFFAYTIYPPYNVPIDCEINKKKQSSTDDKVTLFQLQPVVILNEITKKFYDRNPIYISVSTKTKDIEDQEKYKIGDKVKASIYMGVPWVMRDKCSYTCSGTIQEIKTDAYLYKQIENYEQKYIEKKNKLIGNKKKQKNNQEIPDTNTEGGVSSLQHQEQSLEIDLDDVDSESDQSENNNKKNKEEDQKAIYQEKIKKKKVRIHIEDSEEESVDEYDTEEEDGEEDQEEGEEDDLNEYGLDEEDEDDDEGEKEEVEPEEEVQ